MKHLTAAIQSKVRKEEVLLVNYGHIDEETFLKHVLEVIRRMPNVAVGRKRIGSSEDYYECSLSQENFIIFYDIDYKDVSIIAENDLLRQQIIHWYNKCSQL